MQLRRRSSRWLTPFEQLGEPTEWAKEDSGIRHYITAGENIMDIAMKYYQPSQYEPSWWRAIVNENPDILDDTIDLTPGDVIIIPPRPRSSLPGETTT